jgi:hypothetical protein
MESEPRDSAPARGEPVETRDSAGTSRADPDKSLHAHFDELAEGIRVYVESKIDLLKLTVWRGVVLTGIFIVAVLGAASVFVTAVVLLCMGVSDGISDLIGHRWAGELATGLLVVGGGAAATFIYIRTTEKRSHRRTVEKYEALERRKEGNGKHHE